jgi:acyl-CoA synthetase (AMP-forming)/AMP-acid ligase II
MKTNSFSEGGMVVNSFEMPMGQLFHLRAKQFAEFEALVGPRRRLSYQEYEELTNQVAHFLLSLGIKKGDRIAVVSETNILFPLLFYGALKIGAVIVPINWRWTQEILVDVIQEIEPKIVFFDESFAGLVHSLKLSPEILTMQTSYQYNLEPEFARILSSHPNTYPQADVQFDDLAAIVYTSGSTGKPKGVVLTHRNLYYSGLNNALNGYMRFQYRFLFPLMLSHISAVGLLSAQIMLSMTIVFLPEMTPQVLLETIEKEKINMCFLVPPLLRLLLPMIYQGGYTLSSLNEIITGGSVIPTSLIEDYAKLGFTITTGYGLTENSGTGTYWTPSMGMEYYHSLGRAFLSQVVILDRETREVLPVGEIGEIAFIGPTVFKEYWNDPEETKRAKHNGYLLTGDAGYMDEKGFVYFVDRYKDVIYFGGTGAIFPSKVEGVIKQLEEIADVAVVGLHHEQWGEVPCAFVVAKSESGLTREKVFAHVYSRLPKHNLVDVIFVDQLPRNAMGKVDKPLLKKNYKPNLANL